MKIVVGLGNPGAEYEGTRHNIGWMVLDRIVDRARWTGDRSNRDAASVVRARYRGLDLLLVKPTTYMNRSGQAVRRILAREQAPVSELLVVVDDFALPLGKLRLRDRGSAGGHNGLRSIIEELGDTRFDRLRIGIGAPRRAAVDHVLQRFESDEQELLDVVVDAAADAVEDWARIGISRAGNRWNAWAPDRVGATKSSEDRPAEPSDRSNASARSDVSSGGRAGPPSAADARIGRGAKDAGSETSAPVSGSEAEISAGRVVRRSTGWRRLLPDRGEDRR